MLSSDSIPDLLPDLLRNGLRCLHRAGPAPAEPASSVCAGPRLLICCRGQHRLRVAGYAKVLVLAAGDAVLLSAGSWNQALPGRPREYISFTLQSDGLRVFWRWHRGGDLADSPCDGRMLPCPPQDDLALWRLLQASRAPDQSVALAAALAWRCWQLWQQAVPADADQQRWSAISAWLLEQLPHVPDRANCARAFGMHPSTLGRLFQRQAACSYQDWCRDQRLQCARELLHTQPELSVQQIAQLCGYNDPRYFRRCYKAVHGLPPGRDRS